MAIILPGVMPGNAATLTGSLTFLRTEQPMDLTAEGAADWMHWGLFNEASVERKHGVPAQIGQTVIGSVWDGPYWLEDAGGRMAWSDGQRIRVRTNVTQGVFFIGLNHGVRFECPAESTQKTLKLYMGINRGRARLTAAWLAGGSAVYTNTLLVSTNASTNGVFTLNYQADAAGQTLVVEVVLSEVFSAEADLRLLAATLTGEHLPPAVAVDWPADETVYEAPATVPVSASARATGSTITNVALFLNDTLQTQTAGPAVAATFSNLTQNTYTLTATATDATGLSATSFPVRVFVTSGGGVLQGSVRPPPPVVDLTAEGALDWVHWGFSGTGPDRKAGVPVLIPNLTLIGVNANKLDRYDDNFTAYTWSDGTPAAAATNTATGIFVTGLDTGFELRLPASPTLRRARIYVGLWAAQGRFEAWLTDGSGPPYTDTSVESAYPNAYALYTLDYASRSAAASLVIRWTAMSLYDHQWGNVTWQAVTLNHPPVAPELVLQSAPPATPIAFTFFAEPGASYTVLSTETLDAADWRVLTNFVGTGATVQVTDGAGGAPRRFYRVQVE